VTPFPFLLNTLAGWQSMVFDPAFVQAHGGPGLPRSSTRTFSNTNAIPGTGPYLVNASQIAAYVEFTQNPTYWGKNLTASRIRANPLLSPGRCKTITVKDVQSDVTRYADLTTGVSQISLIETTAPNGWLMAAELPVVSGTYAYQPSKIRGFYWDPNLIGIVDVPS
jgi:ABC-type transport system substrate-binding protein